MSSSESSPPPGRSWRNIRQEVKPLAMSRKGRRRQIAGWIKIGAVAVLCGTVVGVGVHSWDSDRASLASAMHSAPVRNIELGTTGVLTKSWAAGVLALPREASLMALDLPALRDRLHANGQVQVAVLTRKFPDTLVVTLQERTPVARVQAADIHGARKQLMVARDGVIYEGLNYDREMLASLPWLDGIRLVRAGGGFAPIPGMADVSALLVKAQLEAPHLYREWIIVSLARLAGSDEIVVTTQDKKEIIFTRKLDFFKQIALLDSVTERVAQLAGSGGLQSVNLSYGNHVPVQLTRSVDELAGSSQPAPSLPTPHRKAKRDL